MSTFDPSSWLPPSAIIVAANARLLRAASSCASSRGHRRSDSGPIPGWQATHVPALRRSQVSATRSKTPIGLLGHRRPRGRPPAAERLTPPFVGHAALGKIGGQPLPRQVRLSPADRVATDVDQGHDAGRGQQRGELIGRARAMTDGSNHRPALNRIEARARQMTGVAHRPSGLAQG